MAGEAKVRERESMERLVRVMAGALDLPARDEWVGGIAQQLTITLAMADLLETIELVADHVNPHLRLLGVVLCMYEAGTRLAGEIGRDVDAFFTSHTGAHPAWGCGKLFATRIRRNIRLAEAPSFGRSIFDYAAESHGAEDYAALAAEVDQAAAVVRDAVRRVA